MVAHQVSAGFTSFANRSSEWRASSVVRSPHWNTAHRWLPPDRIDEAPQPIAHDGCGAGKDVAGFQHRIGVDAPGTRQGTVIRQAALDADLGGAEVVP